MPALLDRAQIGKTFAPKTREVEAGRLRFFLDVIGDREKAFAPGGALQVPPTYLFCLEMMDDPDPVAWLKGLGVNLMYILHGTQRFDYHALAHAGDRLVFASRIDDIYDKKDGALQFIVRKTDVSREGGGAVATLSSTVVYRDPQLKARA